MAIDTLERAARLNPKGYRPVDAALQQPTPAVSPQPLVPQAPQPFHISPLPASLTTPNVYQQQSRIAGVPHIDLPITQSSVTTTTQATIGVSINTVAASGIAGPQGPKGDAGTQGPIGFGMDGADGEDAMPVLAPTSAQGAGVDYVVMSDGANPPSAVNDGAGNFIYTGYSA